VAHVHLSHVSGWHQSHAALRAFSSTRLLNFRVHGTGISGRTFGLAVLLMALIATVFAIFMIVFFMSTMVMTVSLMMLVTSIATIHD
jgi:hypothetical protein